MQVFLRQVFTRGYGHFFACILTSHVFRVWLSLKAWPEHLSKYHFCSWRLRSNLFLAICQLILSLIPLSCIWYGHICSWEIQFRDKPDKSISDRIQLWLDHVSGQERNGKRGKGSNQRRNQRPELQPEICFEPNLERITQNNRKGQRTWRSSGLQYDQVLSLHVTWFLLCSEKLDLVNKEDLSS